MGSKQNDSSPPLKPQVFRGLISALRVNRSSDGRYTIVPNDQVLLQRTESGQLQPAMADATCEITEKQRRLDDHDSSEVNDQGEESILPSENSGQLQPAIADATGEITEAPPKKRRRLDGHDSSEVYDQGEESVLPSENPAQSSVNDQGEESVLPSENSAQSSSNVSILPPDLARALMVDSGSEASSDEEDYSEETVRQILEDSDTGNNIDDETVGPTAEMTEDLIWSSDFRTFTGTEEIYSERPGPTTQSTNPFQLFSTVWDRSIMEKIAHETNNYAWHNIASQSETEIRDQSRLNEWVDVTVEELYKFFSILIYMSICNRSRLDEYWTTGVLGMTEFRKIMSRNRFYLILKFLHFVDNDDLTPIIQGRERKIFKIAPIVDHCNRKFKEMYVPQRHLSLDESLLLWKGRLSWVQCIRSKAARFGIKSYELCEAETGYLLKLIIYSGKNTSEASEELYGFTAATSKIVIRLMTEYFQKGHCLVMDNFFNSVALTLFLKEQQGTDLLGVLNRRRQDTPTDIKVLVDRQMPRGEIVARHCGNVTVLAWKDVKLVTMLSTYHNSDTAPGQRAGESCDKPIMVHSYNKYMGGVDLKDQILSMYLLERKRGLKWYLKFFRRLLNITILNTFIIHRSNSKDLVHKLNHRQYRYALAQMLSEQHHSMQRVRITHPTETETPRLDGIDHFPQHIENVNRDTKNRVRYKRGRCARCLALKKRTETNVACSKCTVFLCIGQCWLEYHTKLLLS